MSDPCEHTINKWKTLAKPYDEKFKDFTMYNESYAFFCSKITAENPEVFEVGCGPGTVTQHLHSLLPTANILATDVSSEMIEFAARNVPSAKYQILDAREIDSVKQTFNGFLSGFCILYLDKIMLTKFVENASNLLNENGIIYLSFLEGDYADSKIKTPTNDIPMDVFLYQEADLLELYERNSIEHLKTFRLPYSQPDGSTDYHLILIGRKNTK